MKSISNELDSTIHVIASQLSRKCDVISNRLWRHQRNENRFSKIVILSSFMDSLYRVRNKIVTNGFCAHSSAFSCIFTSLLRNSGNKRKNNHLMRTETIRHSSTPFSMCDLCPFCNLLHLCLWAFPIGARWLFECLSIYQFIKQKSQCYPQDNGLILPKSVKHKNFRGDSFPRWSQGLYFKCSGLCQDSLQETKWSDLPLEFKFLLLSNFYFNYSLTFMEISIDGAYIVWTHWRYHYEKETEYLKHKCCCPEYTSDDLNFQASRDKWELGEYIEHIEGETKGCIWLTFWMHFL